MSPTLRSAAVLALLALAASACDVLTGVSQSPPASARVRVEAPAGVTVTLVTSDLFVTAPADSGSSSQATLESADTTLAVAPIDRTVDIHDTRRFAAYVIAADSTAISIRMQVWIDGAQKYDQTHAYPGPQLGFQYIYGGP